VVPLFYSRTLKITEILKVSENSVQAIKTLETASVSVF